MRKVGTLTAAFSAMVLAGCATHPDSIGAQYVSPDMYNSFTCDQIRAEGTRLDRRLGELHASLSSEAESDQMETAVGLILFWPALFFLEGSNSPQTAEYARLKGERDALSQAAVRKSCA